MTKPTIAIIGTGAMCKALTPLLAKAGYGIFIGSRDAKKGAKAAADLGSGIRGGGVEEAVRQGDAVIFAVPFDSLSQTAAATGPLDGKLVIDVTNPFTPEMDGLIVGHTTSAAEELQKLLPKAKVVKAFHLFFASRLNDGSYFGGAKYKALYAGDDAEAKETVAAMLADIGLEPVDAGPLKSARLLEPLAVLVLKVGYGGIGRGS